MNGLCVLIESVKDDYLFGGFANDIALVVKKLEYFLWEFYAGFRF